MRRHMFDLIDTILFFGIIILIYLIARIVMEDYAEYQAALLVTPQVQAAAPATSTPAPPSPTAPKTARTATPHPTLLPQITRTPAAPPTVTATSLPTQGIVAPNVTPIATTLVRGKGAPPPAAPIPLSDGSITIALLGSDKRPRRGDYRTDTVILVNVAPNLPAVTMLSIPRDLWVYIPGYQFGKINVADEQGEFTHFPGGGAELLKQTIEYNLGIHVDYYARVDFAGFMKIIDTLGGIDVVANCPLHDIFPDDPIGEDPTITGEINIPAPGIFHLDGKHALWYARSRETTSDFDRGLRQQRVLRAIWNKANQLGLLARLPELWGDLSSAVKTDLKLNDLLWLATVGARLDSTRIKNRVMDGTMVYHWTTADTKAWVVSPLPGKIGPALQETFSSPTNIAEQAQTRVEVWNGSPYSAWGVLAADRLASEGYAVTNVAPADRNNYARSQMVDFSTTTKGSRRSLLAALFRVADSNILVQPGGNGSYTDGTEPAQYRLIVGADYQPCVRPRLPSDGLPVTATPAAP